jgi:hypothetical protein
MIRRMAKLGDALAWRINCRLPRQHRGSETQFEIDYRRSALECPSGPLAHSLGLVARMGMQGADERRGSVHTPEVSDTCADRCGFAPEPTLLLL